MTPDKFIEECKKRNLVISEEMITQLDTYAKLLKEWNSKMNLTAIDEREEVYEKHFFDSILPLNDSIQGKVADVGTGAGFPGIPIKIYRPEVEVTLVESLNKRINFLNEVISKLGLEKINTIHARVEEFARNKKYREKFDIVTARAVANLTVLSEYLLPLTKTNGKCICMKGSNIEEECKESKKAIEILGGKIVEIEEFYLPDSDIKRNIINIKKIKLTPAKYPRKPGTPAKEPIR